MRRFICVMAILSGFLFMSIYEPFSFRIKFQTGDLNSDLLALNDSLITIGNSGYVEIVWNTGDTGAAIIIDTPGVYIVSVKDIWSIKEKNGTSSYKCCYFSHGYPDTVHTDTFRVYNIGYEALPLSHEIEITSISNGVISTRTYVDTSYMENDTTYLFTETHVGYNGFWSGKLDTIVITELRSPVVIGSNITVKKGGIVLHKKWRATY